MVKDFIPTFADSETNHSSKGSQEINLNIDGETDPDPRIELDEYKRSFLKTLKNLDPTSILDHQQEAKKFSEDSEIVCCKSCYQFGFYNSPKTNYDLIVGKHDLQEFEEDPRSEEARDNTLFNMSLDTPEFKRQRIDGLTGYEFLHSRDDSPENNTIQPSSIAERELMNVKTWNRILMNKSWRHRSSDSSLTDLEVSVSNSLEDYFHAEEQARTFEITISPGASVTLNMYDLEKMALKSTYRPLPIYYFEHGRLTLRTILDTGAATNYI